MPVKPNYFVLSGLAAICSVSAFLLWYRRRPLPSPPKPRVVASGPNTKPGHYHFSAVDDRQDEVVFENQKVVEVVAFPDTAPAYYLHPPLVESCLVLDMLDQADVRLEMINVTEFHRNLSVSSENQENNNFKRNNKSTSSLIFKKQGRLTRSSGASVENDSYYDDSHSTPLPSVSDMTASERPRSADLDSTRTPCSSSTSLSDLFAIQRRKTMPSSTSICVNKHRSIRVVLRIANHLVDLHDGSFVVSETEGQLRFFNEQVGPMLEAAFNQRQSLTICTYGPTGCGMTYTLFGPDGSWTLDDPINWGILPRVVDFFTKQRHNESSTSSSLVIYVNIMEIFNDKIYDLLNGAVEELQFYIDEKKAHMIMRPELIQLKVDNMEHFAETWTLAMQNRRRVASSHRSHVVCLLTLEIDRKIASRFSFFDLAGFQVINDNNRHSASTTRDINLINRSLSSVERIFIAINNKEKFLKLRDSKLSVLLLDSLICSKAKTILIACLNSADNHANHTCRRCVRFAANISRCDISALYKLPSKFT